MGAFHWLILIPVYFFGALSLYAVLDAGSRVARADVPRERIATWAVAGSILSLFVLFASGALSIDRITFLLVVVLGLLSFVLAGIDAALVRAVPLPSDEERGYRHSTDPQVM